MKINWYLIIFLVLMLLLGVYIGKSCNSNDNLTSIHKAMAQRDKNLKELAEKMEQIDSTIKALNLEREEIKNYYTYETYKIDSLIQLDSAIVNSIIRARMDRLFRLQEFFITAPDSIRTGLD